MTGVDTRSETTYVISKLYTSFSSYFYIQYNVNLILVSINCRLSTCRDLRRPNLNRLSRHPMTRPLLSDHQLMRTRCGYKQLAVPIRVASIAWGASIVIHCPLHLWPRMHLLGPCRWRRPFALMSMSLMRSSIKDCRNRGNAFEQRRRSWRRS